MFTTTFVELLGLLGSIIVSGLIIVTLGVVCLFGLIFIRGFQAAYKASKKENDDEVSKM